MTTYPSEDRKRKTRTDNSKIKEQFPDDPWYALDHEEIIERVGSMCDGLAVPLLKYCANVEGLQELLDFAQKSKALPELKQFCVAVLGEQGVGKSSLINAIVDRDLLDNSGSSQACTALATKILHKKDARDRTRSSDMAFEFLDESEIRECIVGQIQCWTELHPGPGAEQYEDDEEEEDDYELEESAPVNRGPKKSAKAKRQAAATAKEFFGIIFNTQKEEFSKKWLENMLQSTDIRTGEFKETCCKQAKERLVQITKELGFEDGLARFADIHDRELAVKQNEGRKIWPFIKLVTIATGNILLRHGLCLFDLPGYGDTSHLRTAVINTFRRKADFEMVVVPSSRVATSETHDAYLDLSLHLKGASKTMALIDENNMYRQIKQIEEEPFISFTERLDQIHQLTDDGEEEIDPTFNEKYDELLNEVTEAYIKRETEMFRIQLQEKGITELFSVAAMSYTAWKNPNRRYDPVLTREQSGIPTLRRQLFLLPAKRNIRDYREHVFEKLPSLRIRAACVAEKHAEDESYANMRLDCKRSIPLLEQELRTVSVAQVDLLVSKPWIPSVRHDISGSIRSLVGRNWIHSKIHVSGFAKIIREWGIPLNGKYKGRNLNADIVAPMEDDIEQWYEDMSPRIEKLAQYLDNSISKLSASIVSNIDHSKAEPALKLRALEALEDAQRRVSSARDTLEEKLADSLNETRIHFTTEIDITCPIAKEMSPVYKLARELSGKGVMEAQRLLIANCITADPANPKMKPMVLLAKKIEGKVVKKQKKAWNAQCNEFIEETIGHFEEFLLTTERLLIDEAYTTEEHKKARTELKALLVDFDRSLKRIQLRFTVKPAVEKAEEPVEKIEGPAEKRSKLEDTVDEGSPETLQEESIPPSESVPVYLVQAGPTHALPDCTNFAA
ncbi:hypothetical protein G6011_00263 [Alternaria panax]|uniref:Nuclear GTPase SLIP-GC n=1 Tax=Alternaria panax TaxID=48097 RepID=A0AAD4NUU6_9PLEO|nr:hypothetical protein G6011_00263 [Alternaria panax]